MKKILKKVSISLAMLITSSIMLTTVYAYEKVNNQDINKEYVSRKDEKKVYREKLNAISSNEDTELVTEVDDKTLTVTVYVNGVFNHKVVTDRLTGDMVLTDDKQKVKKSRISDYLSDGQANGNKVNKSNNDTIASNSVVAYLAPPVADLAGYEISGPWQFMSSAYDSTWQSYGFLYRRNIEHYFNRPSYIDFVIGTAIGVVGSVLYSLLAAPIIGAGITFQYLGIVNALGGTVVGGALSASILGVADTCYKGYDYEVKDPSYGTIYGTDFYRKYYFKVTDNKTGYVKYVYQGDCGYTGDYENLILSKIRQYNNPWY